MQSKAKPLFILLFTLSLPILAWGQSDRLYRPNWAVKVNPFAIINYTPGIELGLEKMITMDGSLYLGLSYLDDFGIHPNKNFDGYKILGEYRHYRPLKNRHPNTFLSVQSNFKQTFADGRIYQDRANGNYQQLTDVSVTNTTLAFLVAYGRVFTPKTWLSLDFSVAAGAKWLSVTSDNIPADAGIGLLADPGFLDPRVNSLGSEWFPLLRLQFRVNIELF
ncbi:MAG TPA: hypothetical protein VJ953_16485 [Saprospiraceae bacterium]|nr:hypothetical protein [Saprospiraceae bacterium]